MDEDRTIGKPKEDVGSAKETIGKAPGDKKTERRGKADQAGSKVQKGIGKPGTPFATRREVAKC